MARRQKTGAEPPAPAFDPASVEQARKWILSGASAHDIAAAIRENLPGVADPSGLIVAALDDLRRAATFDSDLVRGFAFEATREIYRRALDSNDHSAALRAIKTMQEIAKHVPDDDHEEAEAEPQDGDDDAID